MERAARWLRAKRFLPSDVLQLWGIWDRVRKNPVGMRRAEDPACDCERQVSG